MFKILKYAHKLKLIESVRTQYTLECPVCNGKLFKVNRKSGAYKCYSSECSTYDIKAALGYIPNIVTENRIYQNPNVAYQNSQVAKEPSWSEVKYIPVEKYEAPHTRILQTKAHTIYRYSDNATVERIDFFDGSKKQCFPKGTGKFGLFNNRYLTPGTVLMAEGEKTANALTTFSNYVTVSAPPFGWTNEYLHKEFFALKHFYGITGIVYFPDHDEKGREKAKLVTTTSWSVHLPCYIVPLNTMYALGDGEDVADLIERNIDIRELLENIKESVVSSE